MEINLAFGDIPSPVRLAWAFGRGHPGPDISTPPEMLAGSALGEGETQGLILTTALADELIAGTDLGYEDLIAAPAEITAACRAAKPERLPSQ